jgi:hypothetical protein
MRPGLIGGIFSDPVGACNRAIRPGSRRLGKFDVTAGPVTVTREGLMTPVNSIAPMLSIRGDARAAGCVVDPFGHHWEIGRPLES